MMAFEILVPLDGSTLAEQALSCAVMLARGLPADLALFRAISIPPDLKALLGDDTAELEAALERLEVDARDYLDLVARRLQEDGLNVRAVVQWGPAAEVIVDYAGQAEIQQIVMATHGYSGISRWRHGSVAERVLRALSTALAGAGSVSLVCLILDGYTNVRKEMMVKSKRVLAALLLTGHTVTSCF